MNETVILAAIRASWIGQTVRDIPWMFGFLEFTHFVGLCVLFGSLLLVDLRLMGVLKIGNLRSVLKFTNWAIAGFAINLLSGIGFFFSNPVNYYQNPLFRAKMLFVLLAGLNVLYFELVERKKIEHLTAGEAPAMDTRIVAGLSLFLWTVVIILGRFLPTLGTG
jgi:hypothetical protein